MAVVDGEVGVAAVLVVDQPTGVQRRDRFVELRVDGVIEPEPVVVGQRPADPIGV